MRIVWCRGCGSECRRSYRERTKADALDQGHGDLAPLNKENAGIDVPFILTARAILEAERAGCEEAVGIAMRDGATMAGRSRGERAFALEVDEMLAEADAAVAEMPEDRKLRLVGGTELGRSRTVYPRAGAAGVRYGGTRGRPRAA